MIKLNEFDSSMSFVANVDESALRLLSHPSSLLIQLADENEWLEDKVGGFKEVIVRYHDEEHRFTPDEVLRALYAARDEQIILCKDCKHYNDGIVNGRYIREPCCEEIGELSFGASYTVDEEDFCSRAERIDV